MAPANHTCHIVTASVRAAQLVLHTFEQPAQGLA